MSFTAATPFELPDRNAFPVPVEDRDTEAFWAATAEGRLVIPRCPACGFWIWQPKPLCPSCHATPEWTEVSGGGELASWAVMHPPVLPAFAETVPYTVLLVELDVGVRMLGLYVDEAGEIVVGRAQELQPGMRMTLRLRRQGDWTVPAWTLTP